MNVFRYFRDEIEKSLKEMAAGGKLPAGLDLARFVVEPPRDPAHGDLSTNAAMVLAKPAGINPRSLAGEIAERLRRHPSVTEVTLAGPGFINVRVVDSFWHERVGDILRAGAAYGDSTVGQGISVNVEYVSANPTGPLHVGHGRGAVFGDALAALLE